MSIINLVSDVIGSNFGGYQLFKLTFAITGRCNSKCMRCGIWKSERKKELTISEIEEFFNNNNYFSWIDITGGEIFLRDDLTDIFRIIKKTQKRLYLVHIPTNGIMTTLIVDTIKKIKKLGFPKFLVTVSLDGLPETNDRLRGVEGDWQKAVETYKQLRKMNSNDFGCFLGMTLSSENSREIESLYKRLAKEIPGFKREELHFNLAHISQNYYQNKDFRLENQEEVRQDLESYIKKKKNSFNPVAVLENIYQGRIRKYIKTKKTAIPCKAGKSSVFINETGDVFPCSMWDMKLGNIKEAKFSLASILINKVESVEKLIKADKCPQCWTPCEAYQSILGNLRYIVFDILTSYD